MATKDEVSRRSFLSTAGAVTAAATATTWTARSYAQIVGAGERIKVGFLGAGGMARSHLSAIKSLKDKNNVEGVAVADCWKTRADEGAELVGAPQSFADYRKAVEHAPKMWQAWWNLGLGLAYYGGKPEALEALRRAEALCPANFKARVRARIAKVQDK